MEQKRTHDGGRDKKGPSSDGGSTKSVDEGVAGKVRDMSCGVGTAAIQIAKAHHHLETDTTPGKRIIDIVT